MRYTAPAVQRTVRVLGTLAEADAPASLAELSRRLEFSKSSLLGILNSLETMDWVRREGPGGKYRLGPAALSLCAERPEHREIRRAARRAMERVAERTGETVLLGIQEGKHIVVHEVLEGGNALRVSSKKGARLPLLASAAGKAFLAGLPRAEAKRSVKASDLPKFSERSVTEAEAFLAEVDQARERGYATDDGEYLQGVRAAAAPIRWASRTVAVVWVVALASSLSLPALETAGRDLVEAAALIEEGLEEGSGWAALLRAENE